MNHGIIRKHYLHKLQWIFFSLTQICRVNFSMRPLNFLKSHCYISACVRDGSVHCGENFWRVSEDVSVFFLGEAIPIYAEIENCSSRLIVPKAAIFQTQTYLASGKTKTVRLMVANVRGNHIASGSTDTWNGKTLKIPPVTPSILDCCIIRVHYSLAVSAEPGGRRTRGVEPGRCCAPERCPFMSVSQQMVK